MTPAPHNSDALKLVSLAHNGPHIEHNMPSIDIQLELRRARSRFLLFFCAFSLYWCSACMCMCAVSAAIIWLMTNRFLVSKQMAIYLHVLMAVRFPIPLGNQPKCTPASPIITRCIGGAFTIIMQLIAFGGVQRPWKIAIIVGQILLTLFLHFRCSAFGV